MNLAWLSKYLRRRSSLRVTGYWQSPTIEVLHVMSCHGTCQSVLIRGGGLIFRGGFALLWDILKWLQYWGGLISGVQIRAELCAK